MSQIPSSIQGGLTLEQYRVLTLLGGLFGLDHFALGSKETGFAKIFVNAFTLGSWWVFDIIQAYDSTKDFSKGLDIPYYGSSGVGKNLVKAVSGTSTANPNALFYINILYLFIAIIISGISASFIGKPAPYGQIATTATTISGVLSTAIVGNLLNTYGPASMLKGTIFAPVTPPPPTFSLSLPAFQRGGGDGASYTDPILLGTIGLLTVAGFVLSASRV
jgi:hypothetical protein